MATSYVAENVQKELMMFLELFVAVDFQVLNIGPVKMTSSNNDNYCNR